MSKFQAILTQSVLIVILYKLFLDLILNNEYNSIPSQLGQTMLSQMNFEVQDGELFIPLAIHHRVGSILLRQSLRCQENAKKQARCAK